MFTTSRKIPAVLEDQVTMKRAGEITIAEVINIVSKYHSDDTGIHLRSTYGSLKGSYDSFVFKELRTVSL